MPKGRQGSKRLLVIVVSSFLITEIATTYLAWATGRIHSFADLKWGFQLFQHIQPRIAFALSLIIYYIATDLFGKWDKRLLFPILEPLNLKRFHHEIPPGMLPELDSSSRKFVGAAIAKLNRNAMHLYAVAGIVSIFTDYLIYSHLSNYLPKPSAISLLILFIGGMLWGGLTGVFIFMNTHFLFSNGEITELLKGNNLREPLKIL
jgi:hypothetical protein